MTAADDHAVVVRVGDEVRAFRNRCVHQDSPLAGGWVRDGVLTCPLHFWRYDVATGCRRDGHGCLDRLEVVDEVVDGVREAFLVVPSAPAARSLRDELLDRARTYDRTTQFEQDRTERRAGPQLR